MDGINPINGAQSAQSSNAGKVAKVAVGALAAASVAAVAIAAHKGDVFNKVKNTVQGAEKGEKLKAIFNRENIKKGFGALGEGFKELGTSIRTRATKAFEAVKGVFTKGKEQAQEVAEEVAEQAQ